MKRVIAFILCLALLTAVLSVNVTALTQEEAEAGYYLVGTFTGWNVDQAFRLSLNPESGEEYVVRGVSMSLYDEFKVVYSDNGKGITEWFPAGFGNNCTLGAFNIQTDGLTDIYFRPDMDGQDDWYFGCIYIGSVLPKPTEPTDSDEEIDGGYYLVFDDSSDEVSERYRMEPYGNHYIIRGVILSTAYRLRVAYSSDLKTIDRLYPENGFYIPKYNSAFYTVEFAPLGDGGGDWFEGYIRAWPCEPPYDTDDLRVNLYADKFSGYLRFPYEDYCTYSELYYHKNEGAVDWVLVESYPLDPTVGIGYGVFDDVVLSTSTSYPFEFGCGVYDVQADTFYSIDKAWNSGYDDLHDVFLHYMAGDRSPVYLGDADLDGELSIIDVTLIQRCLAGIRDLPDDTAPFEHSYHICGPKMEYISDYDCNGEREIIDATLIQRCLVGMPRYKHSFTAGAQLVKKSDGWYIWSCTSFGEAPVEYCYTIDGYVNAYTVYGSGFGDFNWFDPDYPYEPGEEHLSTGYIRSDTVKLPLDSLTYGESYRLTVTAKDAYGRLSDPVKIYIKNIY